MKYSFALPGLFLSILLLAGLAQPSLAQSSAAFPAGFNTSDTVLNEVFDISPDQRFAAVGTSAESGPVGTAAVAIIDTISGARLDAKAVRPGSTTAVKFAQLDDALRVVVTTNDFGNHHVSIYDVSAGGLLAFRSDVQVNNNPGVSSAGSNICVSPATRTGFISLSAGNIRLVSFSLDTGGVLQTLVTPVSQFLNIYEDSTRRLLVGGFNQTLVFIDYSNPSNMQELGRTTLPSSGATFGTYQISTAFSRDGQYLFAGNGYTLLSAVNTTTRQIVGSVNNGRYRVRQLRIFDSGNTRFLVMRGLEDGGNALKGFAVINAADPSNLTVAGELVLGEEIFSNKDFAVSRSGRYIFVGSGGSASSPNGKVTAYSIPSFAQRWQLNFPAVFEPFKIAVFGGMRERILAAFSGSPARVYSFPVLSNRVANFDDDFKTDIGVFRPETGQWLLLPSTGTIPVGIQFGQAGDVPVPADYDGDEVSDLAVYRPKEGRWLIAESSTGATRSVQFGIGSDVPVPADYDGDGKTDIAVFRKSPHRWLILQSGSGGQLRTQKFGSGIIKPVAGDYDGDGKSDLAYFSGGRWQILTAAGALSGEQLGQPGDTPIAGDFDFDGRTDIAVFQPSTATWRIKQSFAGLREIQFGQSLDLPVPADYDGDGKTDLATFRRSDATWRILQSSGNTTRNVAFGAAADIPLTWQK